MCLIVGRQQSRYHLIREPVQSGGGGAAQCVFFSLCVSGGAVGGEVENWGVLQSSGALCHAAGAVVAQFVLLLETSDR